MTQMADHLKSLLEADEEARSQYSGNGIASRCGAELIDLGNLADSFKIVVRCLRGGLWKGL